MKTVALLVPLAGLALSGCASSFYQPTARAVVVCEGARCDRIWQRAQTWLVTNSRYRIQVVNDAIIQTYGPHEYVWDAVAYTLTREPTPNGKTAIAIYGACHGGMVGCAFDPVPPTNRLFYELENTP